MSDKEFRFNNITYRLKKLKPEAIKALEQVLILANTAQIPICGGVFAIAVEVVNMINVRLVHNLETLNTF